MHEARRILNATNAEPELQRKAAKLEETQGNEKMARGPSAGSAATLECASLLPLPSRGVLVFKGFGVFGASRL